MSTFNFQMEVTVTALYQKCQITTGPQKQERIIMVLSAINLRAELYAWKIYSSKNTLILTRSFNLVLLPQTTLCFFHHTIQ